MSGISVISNLSGDDDGDTKRCSLTSTTHGGEDAESSTMAMSVLETTAALSSRSSSLRYPSYSTLEGSSSSLINRSNRSIITTALAPKPRRTNDMSDLTINKLKYSSVGLYGREKELQLLKTTLDKVLQVNSSSQDGLLQPSDQQEQSQYEQKQHEQRQLVLISGYSGTGKTSLANKALHKVTTNHGGLYVCGKFDFNLRNIPYSGIHSICSEICGSILQLQMKHSNILFQKLCNQIKLEVGTELKLILQVIPILNEILQDSTTTTTAATSSSSSLSPTITTATTTTRNAWEEESAKEESSDNEQIKMSAEGSKHQFNFAFLRFIRAISQQFTPLVFVFDDLQWADSASLDLIDVLLTDSCLSKLMVVGIYRTNEVDDTHIFYRVLEEFKVKSKDKDKFFEMTTIEIGNLELDATHKIIQDLLGMDDDDNNNNSSPQKTLNLAEICYKKTHGNVFFLLQFLSMLKERHMLQFNFGTVSWTWDCNEIESSTNASDNVVDLLRGKMTQLSNDLIDVLKLASFLGDTFEVHVLNTVWERSTAMTLEGGSGTLKDSLEKLEVDGFIVGRTTNSTKIDHQNYSWGHDKIQEAAQSLVPETERGAFAAKVGRILLLHLDETNLDSSIFVVVDLLNEGDSKVITDDKARLELARLNYNASRKAISLSAFESAANYAAKGIELLPKNAWVVHYDLTLSIHTIGAKAEGFLGNTETMMRYCNDVISQEDRPIEDKFSVYHIWIDSAVTRTLFFEARDLLLDILEKFKCTFPKNSYLIGLGIASNVVQVKATRRFVDSSKLPLLKDTTRIELLKLLDRLCTVLYMTKDKRMPLVVFRILNWTMKYGSCEYSSVSFATTGMILTGLLNDLPGGSHYGEQAVILMDRSKLQTKAARTMFFVYGMIFPWTKPHRSLLKPLLRGYDIGLQTGDTESATFLILLWLSLKFQMGSSLEHLEADSLLYLKQMKALKRDQAVRVGNNSRQVYLNLLGHDNVDNPTNFSGKGVSEEDLERHSADPVLVTGILCYQGILITYFGDHVRRADLAIEWGHDHHQKAHPAMPTVMFDTFFKGLSCFAAAQETGEKKYAKMGQIFRSKIKKWLDMGNPNIKHYESLLDAEMMAYKGEKIAAMQNYKSSILLSARGGYLHDAALATERFADFHLNISGDREEAVYQIGESLKYWNEWGAIAKVRHLQNKYADLLPHPTEFFGPTPDS